MRSQVSPSWELACGHGSTSGAPGPSVSHRCVRTLTSSGAAETRTPSKRRVFHERTITHGAGAPSSSIANGSKSSRTPRSTSLCRWPVHTAAASHSARARGSASSKRR